MSPTSYQAAPPRVRGRHYRRASPPLSIKRGLDRVERDASAGSARRRRRGAGLRLLEQEQDLAGAREAELLARDLLDAVGIVTEIADVGGEAVVGLVERPDLLPQPGQEASLPVSLDETHVSEQGVEQEGQGDEPEQDEKGLAAQVDRRRLGCGPHRRPRARAARPG